MIKKSEKNQRSKIAPTEFRLRKGCFAEVFRRLTNTTKYISLGPGNRLTIHYKNGTERRQEED